MTGARSLELVVRAAHLDMGREAAATGSPEAPVAGRGELVASRGADGRTHVTRAYATSPLRLLTPVNHGKAAWVYTSSYGGGLVDGDAVRLRVTVGAGAEAYLSTQASTKVYRSSRGTESHLIAQVDAGGLLVLAPDPVVCFARARYRQTQVVRVAPSAGLVLVDWLTSGRRASGERWQFDEYTAHTDLHVGGRLALYDTLSLRGAHGDLSVRLQRFDVLALVVLAGARVEGPAHAVLARVAETPVRRRSPVLMSAAPLRTGGCAVRIAGPSVQEVGSVIERVLECVPTLLGDSPWARKW